ncbi:MAG: hypothetical protein STHCBS139747_004822 [Sporothrix thermara]
MADDLSTRLSAVLPAGHTFGVYHLSTPPTRTDALYHAPPGQRPDRTYVESHFLAVTITPSAQAPLPLAKTAEEDVSGGEVIVFAVEIFVYTTAFATTLFVAKADSSGYLHLLALPKGTPSPIRAVTSTFLAYLVDQRQRPGVQTVVSLFARAQSQYLFPGSVDNKGKHVLDDRGLVKWWCRALDPLLENGDSGSSSSSESETKPAAAAHGYLLVPGLDAYEMRSFFHQRPGSSTRSSSTPSARWTVGHPLKQVSHYCHDGQTPPPRCLIPRYPDDPKARYLDELDDEAERGHRKQVNDKEKAGDKTTTQQTWNGQWRNLRTLEQFWDMMTFRQECSSGRLTGFLWVVFPIKAKDSASNSKSTAGGQQEVDEEGKKKDMTITTTTTPMTTTTTTTTMTTTTTTTTMSMTKKKPKKRKVLRGYIVSRRPRPKTQQRNLLASLPASTPYYRWPETGRGRLLVDETDYKRINELLLQLDFSTLVKGVRSTRRWVQEAGVGSGDWRITVEGKQPAGGGGGGDAGMVGTAPAANGQTKTAAAAAAASTTAVTDLSSLVKRKRVLSEASSTAGTSANGAPASSGVHVLAAGLVRKKPKA